MQANSTDISLKPRDLAIAHLLLRLLIGVNFFNHGIVRIGNIPGFVEQTVKTLDGSYFPEPLRTEPAEREEVLSYRDY
jgi:thiosulfate dehydrogenase (quinone) large subunit